MKDNLITVATYPYSRAELLKGRLESEGIECFLANANVIRSTVPYGVKLKIKETDLENALKIIMDIEEEYGADEIHQDDLIEDIDRLLVPVDFSPSTFNTCEYAIGLASKLNAEITLFHTYYYPIMGSVAYAESFTYQVNMDESMQEIEENVRKQMAQFHSALLKMMEEQNITNIKITPYITTGIAEDEILNFCKEYQPGAIIIGTHGEGKAGELFGSVTTRIVERTVVPVLAIPEQSKYKGINRINILYATNFDESDYKAIRKLMTLIYPFDVKIFCVHIGEEDVWDKANIGRLKKHFNKEYHGFAVECLLLQNTDVIQGLQDFIHEKGIDLIAMTTHKRNFITKFLNPSLTRKMLFHSNTPILVFHSEVDN